MPPPTWSSCDRPIDEAEESEGENASTKSGVSGEEGEDELDSEHPGISWV